MDISEDYSKGESSTNILILSESALNSLKKSDLVQKILDLKEKVVIDADLHKLCEKIERLTESMGQIVAENKIHKVIQQ